MRGHTSPAGLTPLTTSDLPMAIDGGSAIESQCNKLTLVPILIWAGLGLVATGFLIVFFGHRPIVVAPSGHILGDLMLLTPYVLAILGVVLTGGAGYVRRSALKAMQRYVSERYIFCDEDGEPVIDGGLTVNPIGGSELEVGYFMNDDSDERVSPRSSH